MARQLGGDQLSEVRVRLIRRAGVDPDEPDVAAAVADRGGVVGSEQAVESLTTPPAARRPCRYCTAALPRRVYAPSARPAV